MFAVFIVSLFLTSYYLKYIYIHMFASREVRAGKNCSRGLEYHTQDSSKYKDLEGPLLYDVFEKEGPKTDLGGSLLETKDRKTIINITTLSVSI